MATREKWHVPSEEERAKLATVGLLIAEGSEVLAETTWGVWRALHVRTKATPGDTAPRAMVSFGHV